MKDSILQKELKDKYKEEKVFVIPATIIENVADKFTKSKHSSNVWSKYDNLGRYIYRYDAEYNPVFQQIIPYLLIVNEDESKYFVSKRISGEKRLINNLSLGFGGHIDECDGTHEVVLKALSREMNEELDIDPITKAIYIGTMRDMTSKTNDHFGLIFIVKAKEGDVFIKETDKLEGSWMAREEMYDKYSLFEGWSKYLLDYIYDDQMKK